MSLLTPRQRQVAAKVLEGASNKEIARSLGVSERAVKAHVTAMLRKFDVPSRGALIARLISSQRDPRIHLETSLFAAYEHSPFMVAVTDGPEHRFVFVNSVAATVAGRSSGSLVGKRMVEAYPDLDPTFGAALDRTYSTGKPWTAPRAAARFPRADGTVHDTYLDLLFVPLRDAAGKVTGLLHLGIEVSAPKT